MIQAGVQILRRGELDQMDDPLRKTADDVPGVAKNHSSRTVEIEQVVQPVGVRSRRRFALPQAFLERFLFCRRQGFFVGQFFRDCGDGLPVGRLGGERFVVGITFGIEQSKPGEVTLDA